MTTLKNLNKNFFYATFANCLFFVNFSCFFLLPLFLDDNDFTKSQIGMIMSTFGFSSILLTPYTSTLIDKYGKRLLSLIALFLMILSSLLFIFISQLEYELMEIDGVRAVNYVRLSQQENIDPISGESETEVLKKTLEHLDIIKKDLISIFEKNNIKPIDSLNKKLDPNFHQAMMEIEDDTKEPGTIIQEIQKGFTIKDRLLRPSLVGVSKKVTIKEEKTQENQENPENK